jgi:hypothetical protein
MNRSALARWRYILRRLGIALLLSSALLYGLLQTRQADTHRLEQADVAYQAQQYLAAITAYEGALQHARTPAMRMSRLLFAQPLRPGAIALQIANCRYRIAETELHDYQRASRDPRLTPRPFLVKVQRLLNEAELAYQQVPDTEPPIYQAAQVNAARVRTWQLILAAVDEQTTGRRALKQLAAHAIQQAAAAVDYSHSQQAHISRQARMTAILLLETLTTFTQQAPQSLPPRAPDRYLRHPLGDLLLQDTPELSSRERQRFQQCFFALPIEAKNPWPSAQQGGAGSGQQPPAH